MSDDEKGSVTRRGFFFTGLIGVPAVAITAVMSEKAMAGEGGGRDPGDREDADWDDDDDDDDD